MAGRRSVSHRVAERSCGPIPDPVRSVGYPAGFVSDLPLAIDPALVARVEPFFDREAKLIRAIDSLAPIAGRDVVLVDAGRGRLARGIAGLGGRLIALGRSAAELASLEAALAEGEPAGVPIEIASGDPRALGLPDASADTIVAAFSAYRGLDAAELVEADRVLRPGGRLLVVHEYGRDDLAGIQAPDRPEYASWSRRDGPFLRGGFRVRVIHCWWTFGSLDEAGEVLEAVFGEPGRRLADGLRRPRLSHNLAVYHRTRDREAG